MVVSQRRQRGKGKTELRTSGVESNGREGWCMRVCCRGGDTPPEPRRLTSEVACFQDGEGVCTFDGWRSKEVAAWVYRQRCRHHCSKWKISGVVKGGGREVG
ncbi:hypothetical protein DCAR_0101040 [Daucus carota subsp. sativus]|uniref:Uncharacterized protein n=1 Tax=Daucus carota subsp. sativus TaxID=79200 RepID=A0A166G3H8_DAUCS|nr:hypothetical protein DCAR_0101040 [Daucus carota subsp. sativus]